MKVILPDKDFTWGSTLPFLVAYMVNLWQWKRSYMYLIKFLIFISSWHNIICFDFIADASPTASEQEVYSVVSSVLDEAPKILHELQSYQGANEEIRQVSFFTYQ